MLAFVLLPLLVLSVIAVVSLGASWMVDAVTASTAAAIVLDVVLGLAARGLGYSTWLARRHSGVPFEVPQPAGPVKADPLPQRQVVRHVNVCVVSEPGRDPHPRATSLAVGRAYALRIDIGARSSDSVVENPEPFPAELLPATESGHWLTLSVAGLGLLPTPAQQDTALFLPTEGTAWACDCTVDGPHRCRPDERRREVFVPFRTAARAGSARLRLSIRHRGGLVQSLQIAAEVELLEQAGIGVRGRIDYTLTSGLRDLDSLPPRDMSIVTETAADGSHTLTFNGLGAAGEARGLGRTVSFRLTEGQVRSAATAARTVLRDLHMTGGRRPRNRLDPNNGKPRKELEADLRSLALFGRRLWNVILADQPTQRRSLSELLARSATVQVARAARSSLVFPWALVYDIPLEDGNPEAHRLCRSLDSFDPATPAPRACPHAAEHSINTLCPYGFWGFRHAIEQPPSVPNSRALPVAIRTRGRADMVLGLTTALDQSMTTAHVRSLRRQLAQVAITVCTSREQIVTGLSRTDLPLVYFYCHGRREAVPGAAEPLPYLEVGTDERITPGDVTAWFDGLWPHEHWTVVPPLVFINGCHTAEITPESLCHFVDAFAGVNAAGVIGTETAVHQALAGEVAELFWDSFATGATVGEALADMRTRLLGKGNLLGLAYTAYCSSELHLVLP
ncbi:MULTISPECIES: hypothetical protein [Streptacidiphilus]|uniref:CHAT domain-containing protein n=1 Tax=Streptacidiphilus cavernicola TaxID=3342716 RepID=A0ABV6UPH3_9ACTN|nr:hypothetical protein [Streptacidiphilus jeojiense]